MAWIESHTVLLRHRKLVELARDLRLKPVYCLGHLHGLWHAALEQREDGDLSTWSDEFIAENAAFSGDAPTFVSLLEKHGWLTGRMIHDWLDYAGRYLIARYSSKNRERLEEIWRLHGRVYGEQKVSERRVKGECNRSPPEVRFGSESKTENDSVSDCAETAPNLSPQGLAWRFRSLIKGRPPNSQESEDGCAAVIEEMITQGVGAEAILAEFDRRGKHVETIWNFAKRLTPKANGTDRFAGLKRFAERAAADGSLHKEHGT